LSCPGRGRAFPPADTRLRIRLTPTAGVSVVIDDLRAGRRGGLSDPGLDSHTSSRGDTNDSHAFTRGSATTLRSSGERAPGEGLSSVSISNLQRTRSTALWGCRIALRRAWDGTGTVEFGEDGVVWRDGQLLGEHHKGSDHGTLAASGGRSTIGWPIAPRQAGRLRWALDTGRERDAGRGLRSEPSVECLLTGHAGAWRRRDGAHGDRRSVLPPFSRAGSGRPSVPSRTGRLRWSGGLGQRGRCDGNGRRPAAC
jgi:hypothetical protein